MKQLILVRSDIQCKNIAALIAKAPMKLVTRMFDGSANFIGKSEATEYQKIINSWIDDFDQETKVLLIDSDDSLLNYQMTAELCGCPTAIIKSNESENAVLILGPWEPEVLDDISEGLDEFVMN